MIAPSPPLSRSREPCLDMTCCMKQLVVLPRKADAGQEGCCVLHEAVGEALPEGPPEAALVPERSTAGQLRRGPCAAQMPKAPMLRQAKAAQATRDMKMETAASAAAPRSTGTATCQCRSFALLAIRATTCARTEEYLLVGLSHIVWAYQHTRHHYFNGILPSGNYITRFSPMLGTLRQNCSSSKEADCRLSQLKQQTGRYSAGNSTSRQNPCQSPL